MILVDTSVWIRFFADRPPYAEGMARLLQFDEVAGHELVHGELLVGDPGGGRKLLYAYERIPFAKSVPHEDVVDFVLRRKLYGRGAGWIDIHLLASALVAQMPLWTADAPLLALAQELKIAYKTR
jgi:predicted nucleic acid-binding protein